MKQYNFNRAVPMVWAATLSLAGSLLAAGIQTVSQGVRFPDHHLFTLLGLIVLCWIVTGSRELVALRLFYRHTRRVASSTFSRMVQFTTRAAEAAALLFTFQPFNRPRTEP